MTFEFPAQVFSAWMGNPGAIGNRRYLQVREEDFQRTAEFGAAGTRTVSHRKAKRAATRCGLQPCASCCGGVRIFAILPSAPVGFESVAATIIYGKDLHRLSGAGAAESGASLGDLDFIRLMRVWPDLDAVAREAILRIAGIDVTDRRR